MALLALASVASAAPRTSTIYTIPADTPATVKGAYLGRTGTLGLTVLNVAGDFSAIEKTLYTVNEEAGTVNIRVLRTGSTDGAVTVNLSTGTGTATPGSGGDYTPVSNVAVPFSHGESFRDVSITILQGNAANEANARLDFTGGLLSGPRSTSFNLSASDVVSKITGATPTDANLMLTVTRSSGLFSGVFTHSDGTKPAFKGVIFQKNTSAHKGGHDWFLSTTPAVKDYTGEGGRVSLQAK